MNMEYHPACLLLPKMSGDEYLALRRSIKNGYDERHCILLHEGRILDGRHRYLACLDEEIQPQYTEFTGNDPYVFVKQEHEARRSWRSQEQKAIVIGNLLEQSGVWLAEQERIQTEANRKRAESAKEQPRTETGFSNKENNQDRPHIEDGPQSAPRGQGSQTKATLIGVNRAAVERADFIKKNGLAEKVVQGELTAAQAVRDIRKKAVKENLEKLARRETVEPTGLYDVLIIDPPWPIQKIHRDTQPNQTGLDYPTMTSAEISELHLPMADNCHVWLWTTQKFLPDAIQILRAWELKYVCTFVWHKTGGFQPFELPQYNCEFVLYARCGTPKFIDLKNFPTCFNAPRGAHSEKPDEYYDLIRRVTAGRRLDMFNRRLIDGFKGWGNES